jgi:CRISPR-associated protein Cas1
MSRQESEPLVPARALNEWVYCQRLGILEWVHSEFEDNVYTAEGTYQHRRVDRPGPALDALAERTESTAEGGDGPLTTRSVYLESDEDGLVARMDLVELDGDEVSPVDTKRGRPPRPDQEPSGVWEPDRIQLAAQALVLRSHGYLCERGFIYYAGSRRRVEVIFDDELIALVRSHLSAFREMAASGKLPAPLENSPKCLGCSLAPICLPDETVLLGRDDASVEVPTSIEMSEPEHNEDTSEEQQTSIPRVRRLMTPLDDRRPLYISDSRARVGCEKERFVIKREDEVLGQVRVRETSQIVIFGRAQVSTMAMREAMDRGIPVLFFTFGGYFAGLCQGHSHKNIVLREAQFRAAFDDSRSLAISRQIVRSKIRNQRTMLRRNARDLPETDLRELQRFADAALRADSTSTLLGLEGAAAAVYFRNFSRMLRSKDSDRTDISIFDFETRNRRPPKDPVNALLSLLYSLLTRECVATALAVGLDPYMGFYHRPRYGKPALGLDLMEEVRPLIGDSVVMTLINQGEVKPSDFVTRADGCNLTEAGRRTVFQAYERRMNQEITHPIFGYRLSWRRVLEVQARLLGRHLLGEIPAYPPIETR